MNFLALGPDHPFYAVCVVYRVFLALFVFLGLCALWMYGCGQRHCRDPQEQARDGIRFVQAQMATRALAARAAAAVRRDMPVITLHRPEACPCVVCYEDVWAAPAAVVCLHCWLRQDRREAGPPSAMVCATCRQAAEELAGSGTLACPVCRADRWPVVSIRRAGC
jgi:hypothetical protein